MHLLYFPDDEERSSEFYSNLQLKMSRAQAGSALVTIFEKVNPVLRENGVSEELPPDTLKEVLNQYEIEVLLSKGVFDRTQKGYDFKWNSDTAKFTIAKSLVDTYGDFGKEWNSFFEKAIIFDELFQTHLFPYIAMALLQRLGVNDYKNLTLKKLEAIWNIPIDTFDEINFKRPLLRQWNHTSRRAHYNQHGFSTKPPIELETIFLLTCFRIDKKNSLHKFISLSDKTEQLLRLEGKLKLSKILHERNFAGNRFQASFIFWEYISWCEKAYNKWQGEAGKWRSLIGNELDGFPTPLEWLKQKSKLDREILDNLSKITDIFPAFSDDQVIVRLLLETLDQLSRIFKKNWQETRSDSRWFENEIARIAGKTLLELFRLKKIGFALQLWRFLKHEHSPHYGIHHISLIGIHLNQFGTEKKLRDFLRKTAFRHLLQCIKDEENTYSLLPLGFDEEFKRRMKVIFSFIFEQDEFVIHYLQSIEERIKNGPIDNSSAYNWGTNCAFALLPFVFFDKGSFDSSIIQIVDNVIFQTKNKQDQIFQYDRQKILRLINDNGWEITSSQKPERNASEFTSKQEKEIYLKHLVHNQDFEEAISYAEDELAVTQLTKNNGGQNSEAIYFWLLSLYNSEPDEERLSSSLDIFDHNRKCIGISEVDSNTLAGAVATKAKEYDRALKYWDNALKVHPGNMEAWFNKIATLIQAEKGEEALLLYKNIPNIYLDNLRGQQLELATKISALKNIPDIASQLADKLIEVNPKDLDAKYNKAIANIYAGKFEVAVTLCKEILDVFPSDQTTENMLKELEAMQSENMAALLKQGIKPRIPIEINGKFRNVGTEKIKVGEEANQECTIALCQIPIAYNDDRTLRADQDQHIQKAIQQGLSLNASFMILPELSIPERSNEFLQDFCKDNSIWVLGGATYIKKEGHLLNKSILFSPEGKVTYGTSKIERSKDEPENVLSGSEATIFTGTPLGDIGVLICYDIYMSELLGQLRHQVDIVVSVGANRDYSRLKAKVNASSSWLGVPVVSVNATNFAKSYYCASCYKSDIQKQYDTEAETRNNRKDEVIAVIIPQQESVRHLLAHRHFNNESNS